ncbi:class I glutamine amidotransferase-like protein [Hyaloraphidium curvatum]|nr:class I glutamine amidotransferase-like protein [Hyaloraphidium curvatum]
MPTPRRCSATSPLRNFHNAGRQKTTSTRTRTVASYNMASREGPVHITGVIYPAWELLDLVGPLSVLLKIARAAGRPVSVCFVAGQTAEPVQNTAGVPFVAHHTFDAFPDVPSGADHVIIVPGGVGSFAHSHDDAMLRFLRRFAAREQTAVSSVCTGSSVLANSGVLDGRKATSNKMVFDLMSTYKPSKVDYVADARFVRDGNIWTSSGVSAGVDMGFAIGKEIFGAAAADRVAAEIGHLPLPDGQDPFVGIHRDKWRGSWSAWAMATTLHWVSGFLIGRLTSALRTAANGKVPKKMLVSLLISEGTDSLSLAAISECFACAPEDIGQEVVALGSSNEVSIGDTLAVDPAQRTVVKVTADRALSEDAFSASSWGKLTFVAVPEFSEVPANFAGVVRSLAGQDGPAVLLGGPKVVAAAERALGGFTGGENARGKGWRRAGKFILVTGGVMAGITATLDEIARQTSESVARTAVTAGEFAPDLVPTSVNVFGKL